MDRDLLKMTISVGIGLRFLVDHAGFDVHIDADEKNEAVKAHDDGQEDDTVDGSNQLSGVSRC